MKLSYSLLAVLLLTSATVQAQTHCYDNGLTITCTGSDPAHLLRMPDGSGVVGTVDGKPWSLYVEPPNGLRPLPQLPQLGTQSLQPSPPMPNYWNY